MRLFQRQVVAAIAGCFLAMGFGISHAAAAEYTSPDGMKIHNESPDWDSKEKLQQVYEELKKNAHGEEWKLLTDVTIHDDYPKGRSIAGEYNLKVSVDLIGRKKMLPGSIDIYGGSERTTINSIAKTLAHEYGHHVTHYITMKQNGFPLTDRDHWQETTYAKLRGLSTHPYVNNKQGHSWELPEIAAEDYVQLFGSPTAKEIHSFPSHYDLLKKGKEIGPLKWDASMFNLVPQENIELPLATKVPGLYEWFADYFKNSGKPPVPEEPKLSVKQVTKQGQNGYQIQFDWTQSGKPSPDTTFTFVSYSEEDGTLPEPVVTRKGTEPLEAYYGTIVTRTATSIITYKDPNAKGIRHFRVYIQNTNGMVASSPILTLDMNHPDKVTVTELAVKNQAASSLPVKVTDHTFSIGSLTELEDRILNGITSLITLITRMIENLFKFVS